MTEPAQLFLVDGQHHRALDRLDGTLYGDFIPAQYAIGTFVGGVTNQEVVPAVTGLKIRVLSYAVGATSTGSAQIRFLTNGSPLSQFINLAANSNARRADNNGLFQTNAGENLGVTTSSRTVGMRITYMYVK